MWKPTNSDFVTNPIDSASNGDLYELFSDYERVKIEFNMNPICVATKKGLQFVAYGPKTGQLSAYSDVEHQDNVTEVAWLASGKVCWTITEGTIGVDTGLPTELIEYCEGYGVSGPHTSPHLLVWDVFKGLVSGEDVVLLLDDTIRCRVALSHTMPLVYAGIEAIEDEYDLANIHPITLLTLGWSRILMLVPEAEGSDLTKLLPQVSPVMLRIVTKALLRKREENIINPYDDYDEEAVWAERGT